ncbi:hypothetical protein M707_22875 [Arthrobacter sp. AK-YN10]|nr:hypothetical protein M707_22875 [Arthrobacter sp. AK-YN10]
MAKFDPERFDKMMAELNAEGRSRVIVRNPLEDLEPDPDYLTAAGLICFFAGSHQYALRRSAFLLIWFQINLLVGEA